jgi:hypothetical protein
MHDCLSVFFVAHKAGFAYFSLLYLHCKIYIQLFNGGNTNFAGTVFAPNFVEVGVKRFKENIQDIQDARDIVQRLRGVTSDWKREFGGTSDIGLIAEEVAEVVPEAVVYDEEGMAMGVKYSPLVAVAIEAIKLQQKEIDDMKMKLETLEEAMASAKGTDGQRLRRNA